MKSIQPSPRKLDSLDNWKTLCNERRLAYEENDLLKVQSLNSQLIDIRKAGGWSDSEINEEFQMYAQVLQRPFIPPVGNPNIKYDLRDERGNLRGLSLSLHQIGKYWMYREAAVEHGEALNRIQ